MSNASSRVFKWPFHFFGYQQGQTCQRRRMIAHSKQPSGKGASRHRRRRQLPHPLMVGREAFPAPYKVRVVANADDDGMGCWSSDFFLMNQEVSQCTPPLHDRSSKA